MTSIPADVLEQLAPEGVLRAAINFGNPVLAQQGPQGQPQGVSVALAKRLAAQLNVALDMTTFDAAGKVFAALEQNAWTVAFLAIEPVREAQIAFTEPYVLIEGTYLVRSDSPYEDVAELDQSGLQIAVGEGAAYDLYLSRTLEHATLERAATSMAAVELFVDRHLTAAAGVRQPLEAFALSNSEFRVLPGSFTQIRQAMAVPRGNTAASAYVAAFIEDALRVGFVRDALIASGQADVSAPR